MKGKFLKQIIAIVLALAMCSSVFLSISAATQTDESVEGNLSTYTIDNMPSSLKSLLITGDSEKEKISADNADDLYSVTIDNGDGTQTVNIFQQPIKYIDEDGSIKFRTNSLERISSNSIFSTKNSTYTYKNEEGEVKTYYSDKIENGVSIVYNDYAIAIQPLTDSQSTQI